MKWLKEEIEKTELWKKCGKTSLLWDVKMLKNLFNWCLCGRNGCSAESETIGSAQAFCLNSRTTARVGEREQCWWGARDTRLQRDSNTPILWAESQEFLASLHFWEKERNSEKSRPLSKNCDNTSHISLAQPLVLSVYSTPMSQTIGDYRRLRSTFFITPSLSGISSDRWPHTHWVNLSLPSAAHHSVMSSVLNRNQHYECWPPMTSEFQSTMSLLWWLLCQSGLFSLSVCKLTPVFGTSYSWLWSGE